MSPAICWQGLMSALSGIGKKALSLAVSDLQIIVWPPGVPSIVGFRGGSQASWKLEVISSRIGTDKR